MSSPRKRDGENGEIRKTPVEQKTYPGPPPAGRCRFDHLYDERARERPCEKCAARYRMLANDPQPFTADSNELGARYSWWTATTADGRTATFRVPIVPSRQDAAWRLAEVKTEYENAWRVQVARYERRFGGNPRRGRLYAAAAVNAKFGPIAGLRATGFRPATACEVACWLHAHRDDLLALKGSGEGLLAELEDYV